MTDASPIYAVMQTRVGPLAVAMWSVDGYRCSVCRVRHATTVDAVDHFGTNHVTFLPDARDRLRMGLR